MAAFQKILFIFTENFRYFFVDKKKNMQYIDEILVYSMDNTFLRI